MYYILVKDILSAKENFFIDDIIKEGEIPENEIVFVIGEEYEGCFKGASKGITNLKHLLGTCNHTSKKEYTFWEVIPYVKVEYLLSLEEGVRPVPYYGYKTKEEAIGVLKRKIQEEIKRLEELK